MQPENTPEPNLFQLGERALGQKPTTEEVTGFTALLCAQQLFVRGIRDASDPAALHLGVLDLEDSDESYLYLATSRDLADSLPGDPDDEGYELLSITGEVLLGLAAQRRNNVVIITSDSDDENIIIPHGSLELLAKLAVLTGDRAPQNQPSDEVIRAAYPTAFARWLHEYCRAHSDIREARLALARLGNSSQPDVVVGLEAGAAYSHMDRISAESRRLLKPGQVFYTEGQITGMGQGGSLADDLRRHPPLYRKSNPQGWWSRLMRRLKPAPLVYINVELLDEPPQR